MKSLNEIDLDEWELLPDDGFLEINQDASGEKTFSRNHSKNSSSVFQMNYFICPEKPLPSPIDLPVQVEVSKIEPEPEPEPVSQVFFKKMKETEFVDMKVDSPKSSSEKCFTPQLDFEEKNDEVEKSDPRHEDEAGLNIWRWSLTAICTIAATVCIVSLSGQHKIHKRHQFQFYTNEKRMKQVVHHASKINEAIWAVRGVPITRAQITFGGHYDAPL